MFSALTVAPLKQSQSSDLQMAEYWDGAKEDLRIIIMLEHLKRLNP